MNQVPIMYYPKRILVIPLRFIGDGILTVPLLRGLRALYPEAQIDLLLPVHMANLLERCPYVNEIVIEPASRAALYSLIKAREYHLGILLRRSLSAAFRLKCAGVDRLIGFDEQRFPPPFNFRRWGGWFLDDVVPFPPIETEVPQAKTYLSLLNPLSDEVIDRDESLELWSDEEDKLRVAALFNRYEIDISRPIAVFHGTSASKEKALPRDRFIPALQALHQHGFQIITLGSPGDLDFYRLIALESAVPIRNLSGQTTLRQSAALMLQVNLLLGLDSAPIHMAAAAGVPHIIGIYSATNEKQWRPYPYDGLFTAVFNKTIGCRPCAPKVCKHNRCRNDLTPPDILQALILHFQAIEKTGMPLQQASAQ